jgi:hypothetical protein
LEESPVKPSAVSSGKKKAPVTYGKQKTFFHSPTLEQKLEDSDSKQTVTTVEKIWDSLATMREEWYVVPEY